MKQRRRWFRQRWREFRQRRREFRQRRRWQRERGVGSGDLHWLRNGQSGRIGGRASSRGVEDDQRMCGSSSAR